MSSTAADRHRLHDLLMSLNDARAALRAAEQSGDAERIKLQRRNVAVAEALIRQHCERSGLPLPADVPGESKACECSPCHVGRQMGRRATGRVAIGRGDRGAA